MACIFFWFYFPQNEFKDIAAVKAFGMKRLTEECQRLGLPVSEYKLLDFTQHPDNPKSFGTREERFTFLFQHYSKEFCMDIRLYLDKDREWDIDSPRTAYYGKEAPLHERRYCYIYLLKKGRLTPQGVFIDGITGEKTFYNADLHERKQVGLK
jgi:hypothetical protein